MVGMSTLGHYDINLVRGHECFAWCGVFMTSRYLCVSVVVYSMPISMHHDDCGWCRHKGWSSVVIMSELGHSDINLVRGRVICAWRGVYKTSRHLHVRVWSCYRFCCHRRRHGATWPPPHLGCTDDVLAQRLARTVAPQAAARRTVLRVIAKHHAETFGLAATASRITCATSASV